MGQDEEQVDYCVNSSVMYSAVYFFMIITRITDVVFLYVLYSLQSCYCDKDAQLKVLVPCNHYIVHNQIICSHLPKAFI